MGQYSSLSQLELYIIQFPNKVDINIHYSTISSTLMLVFRIVAAFLLTILLIPLYKSFPSFFSAVEYLSFFGFTLTWLYFTLVVFDFIAIQHNKCIRSDHLSDWINLIYQVALCLELPITTVYWLLLYQYSHQQSTLHIIETFSIHGFPLSCLLIDLIFNTCQFPIRHLFVIMVIGFLYAIVNLFYSLVIKPVYHPINWISLTSYLWVGMAFIAAIGLHRLGHFFWVNCKLQSIIQHLNFQQIQPQL